MNITAICKQGLLLLLLLVVVPFLAGCSPGGSQSLPETRPAGTIKGNVVDGVIVGARVTAYGFTGGVRGVTLGSAITDEKGSYAIEVQAPDQPVLIEVSGGRYVEDASGSSVALADGQVLRAMARYESGKSVDVMVTPLTHLVTGLADYKITNGSPVNQAIMEAMEDINNFFAVDVGRTQPLAIVDANNAISDLNDEILYGFYLAGLSNWTAWAGNENSAPHTTYSSIALMQVLYNDIRSDGVLNGTGYNREGTALMPLAFGRVALDANTFRIAFSLHMLAIANSDKNKTGLGPDKLLAAARQIASQTGVLLGASTPINIDDQSPEVTIMRSADEYYSGVFSFEIAIGGLLGAERVSLSVDGEPAVEFDDPAATLVVFDTTDYADGEHEILITATDALGNTASSSFVIQFDNTAPVISVSSPPASAQTSTLISGTYSDNVSGVQSIIAQGQQATLFTDGTWNAAVNIEPGKNIIPITVIDRVGKRLDTQTILYLDVVAPVIDATDRHSLARFSNGDGSYTEAALQDVNDAQALYFETDSVDLNGVQIGRSALNNNSIPYFAFSVTDQMGPDAITAPDAIQVRIQYERSGEIISPWRIITPINTEYLLPLVSEVLAPDWHQATPEDEHMIRVEVSDSAGNLSNLNFSFRTDFYVPIFSMDTIDDLGAGIFLNTDFADRAMLNNMEFASTAYTFTNTVGKSFYLSLSDTSAHTTTQTVDQLVREHRVNIKTTTEWQLGLMTPTDQCPAMTGWTTTSSVWNWTGSAWVEEQVPGPTYGGEESVFDDTLPASPAPSDWSDAPDFDGQFKITTIDNSPLSILTYGYDYILSPSITPQAGYVFAWVYQDLGNTTSTTCPPKRYFQQREIYTYESVSGYPKPVLSSVSVAGTPDFATSNFVVMDNDTGLAIEPVDGWYRILAGHSVTIRKSVTTPGLVFYNDDVSDLTGFSSYTPNWNDSSVLWAVDRSLMISVIHDAGNSNISAMPARSMSSGAGMFIYQISR